MRARGACVAFLLLLTFLGACTSSDDSEDGGTTAVNPSSTVASTVPLPPFVGVLRIGVIGMPPLDPAEGVPTLHGDVIAADLLYDGLTRLDASESAEPVPAVASGWESNEEGDEFTFTIAESAVFHDGAPITSADVKATLERLAGFGDTSLAGARLEVIEGYDEFVAGDAEELVGVEAVEDRIVRISTTDPYQPLAALLSGPSFGIVPARAATIDSFFDAPVGSGPLRFESQDESRTILVPVPGRALGMSGVELRSFPNTDESFDAFDGREIDWSLVPDERYEEARVAYGVDAVGPFQATFFLGFNTGLDTYEDFRFRQAITQAIDREALVSEVFPSGLLMDGLVPQGLPEFRENACGPGCAFDRAAALNLLDEVFGEEGERPTVAIDYRLGTRDERVAELVAADLDSVGIPTELRGLPQEEYREFVVSSEQELFVFGWVGVVPSADVYLSPLYLTGSADNVTAFSHELVDGGLAAARTFEDVASRVEAYQVAEATILMAHPVVPLVQTQTVGVVDESIQGWSVRIDGTFDAEAVRVPVDEGDPGAVDRSSEAPAAGETPSTEVPADGEDPIGDGE